METRFGHDFSAVRVHTGRAGGEVAEALDARAYTVGHNIVFGFGQHGPGTRAGIAHSPTSWHMWCSRGPRAAVRPGQRMNARRRRWPTGHPASS